MFIKILVIFNAVLVLVFAMLAIRQKYLYYKESEFNEIKCNRCKHFYDDQSCENEKIYAVIRSGIPCSDYEYCDMRVASAERFGDNL